MRPFHPLRLWGLIGQKFVVIQNEYVEEGMEGMIDDESEEDEDEDEDETMEGDESQPQLDPAARL